MAANKLAFGGATAITITPGTLANAAARQSASVDNSTNLYLDALVTATVKAPSSGIQGGAVVNIYVAGSIDGTAWPGQGSGNPDGVTGSDAAITLLNPTNLILLGSVNVATASSTIVSEPMSVAAAFGGTMPRNWSIVIENRTGASLVTGSTLSYNGVSSTTT